VVFAVTLLFAKRSRAHFGTSRQRIMVRGLDEMSQTEKPKSTPSARRLLPIPGGSYQVGDLLVDIGLGRVTREGQIVPLPRLSFDLLIAFVTASPNLMTLQTLMECVWPGVVVGPETVTQRVKVLRDALGDDPKNPRYIEGVRGRGYRLIAKVAPVTRTMPESLGSPGGVSDDLRPDRRGWAHIRTVLIFAAIVAAVLIGYLGYRIIDSRSPAQVVVERKAVTVSAAPPRSIAVLPFENLSTAPDGSVVALGMSEAVLHQLASLEQLTVIARTSSFAFEGRNEDVREIARKLNARYLLEGSVQSNHVRLRVTAQLVDATTGGHLWSIRLDRDPRDIFAVQDEIAQAVAKALQLSLATQADTGTDSHRTKSVEAWLAFQQGRALVATRKISELERAKERFAEAIRIDPGFAAAYVGLAEAYVAKGFVTQSEFWIGSVPVLSAVDKKEGERLLMRALELDPGNGDAYLVRAWRTDDDSAAEADYRRGLALSPNNAAGYAHFARVLFRARGKGSDVFDPAKREEAFTMIDRAREIDPLAPGHYLIKALMLSYGRSDWKQAIALSLQALAQDPNYYPALMKLAEFKWAGAGELAEAAKYGEQALVFEPHALWLRHMLSRIYLDLRDFDAARSVIEETGEPDMVGQIPLEMYRGNWGRVGELAARADTNIPGDFELLEVAGVRSALATGKLAEALKWIDEAVGLKWTADGKPLFEVKTYAKEAPVLMARILEATGDGERARRVLHAALRAMDHDAYDLGRGDNWFSWSRAEALAALGDSEGAIDALIRGRAAAFMFDFWVRVENEPAYVAFRDNPRFRALLDAERSHVDKERALLSVMRADGLVPRRTAGTHQ